MHTLASSHSAVASAAALPAADLVVGEWLVRPDVNQVSRHGESAHLRPQLMNLLVYLAINHGRTVPHGELLANVWPGQPYVSVTALPRCIAELRQTLGDRAIGSTLIQTIPKRGYRLIAAVGSGTPESNTRSGDGNLGVEAPAAESCGEAQAVASCGEAHAAASCGEAQAPERQLLSWLQRARQFASRVYDPLRFRAG